MKGEERKRKGKERENKRKGKEITCREGIQKERKGKPPAEPGKK